ncbi:MAG: L,D-transpeptidase family protein [Acidimicrobiales bacterium]
MRHLIRAALVAATLVGGALVAPSAGATSALRVTDSVAATITTSMPIVRLHFSAPVAARRLPSLVIHPRLATTWLQTGRRDVEAVVTGRVIPSVRYVVDVPTTLTCAATCAVTAVRRHASVVSANYALQDQLLAQLHYLPVRFSPASAVTDPAQPTPGAYTWAFAHLPSDLSAQWRVGTANVVLTGAMMAFQSQHGLTVTGVPDAATWEALDAAARANAIDPATYDYVDVSESLPETLTLYVNGRDAFHALVNTGISVAPTETGTYPVYLRFTSTVMTGFNPDGSYYADPVTWVSYFNGGDALHQFYRASYGWPQSLGCVEMALPDAHHVYPYTPIGTLVTVHS